MPRMVLFSLLILLSSCFENPTKSPIQIDRSRVALTAFTPIVNNKALEYKSDIDFNQDISIQNRDYPVEIWLCSNNKYYYELPNLGEGIGSWSYKGGYLELKNEHHIKTIDLKINMNFDLYFDSKNSLHLNFSDRFGFKDLEIEVND